MQGKSSSPSFKNSTLSRCSDLPTRAPLFETASVLPLLIFIAGFLYSCVGHAGASGYLAAMALFGVSPSLMKPSALLLNILVATIGTAQFYRSGLFSWKLFWPFALTSIPCAFLGGAIKLPAEMYRPLLGCVLLYASVRLIWQAKISDTAAARVRPSIAMILGAGIGFVSGLTGVGGGIFLSPILLLMRWADARRTAAISSAFILVNSIAGIAGYMKTGFALHPDIATWSLAAVGGGLVGSTIGSRHLGTTTLKRLLAVVMLIAGVKLIFV